MKKISLKKLNIREVEKLSREQLKNVLGGWTEESGSDNGEQTFPHPCDDIGDRIVCCTADGLRGTCLSLYENCQGAIVSCNFTNMSMSSGAIRNT